MTYVGSIRCHESTQNHGCHNFFNLFWDLFGALQADNDELAQLGTAEESLGVSIARSREMSSIIVTCWRVETDFENHESFFGNEWE